jgi:hypothetical protein
LENPGEALVAAGRLLKFKVWIVVAVPDYSSLQAKLFGKYWFHLDLPRHLHHFESDWLCGKLARGGNELKIARFAEIDQSLFGFIQSCQNKFLRGIKPNFL